MTYLEKIQQMDAEKMAWLFYSIIQESTSDIQKQLSEKYGIEADLITLLPELIVNRHKRWLESEVESE